MRRALTILSLLLLPAAAHAQTTGGNENPLGIALGFGTVVAPALALPVIHDPAHLPRPGSGDWHVGLGYQSDPHSVVAASDAGGYFGAASWLGLESRFDTRLDGSTGIDANIDAAYLALLRPTPVEWPLWVELMVGASMEAGFGANWPAHITGGPSAGARVGFGIALDEGVRLVLEGEGLYNARFGDAYSGVRHQLETTGRVALMFEAGEPEDDTEIGVALEYRNEHAFTPEPTLPDTHRATVGAVIAF